MKLCKDCRYFQEQTPIHESLCLYERFSKRHKCYVTGNDRIETYFLSCNSMRQTDVTYSYDGMFDTSTYYCGPSAKYWRPAL